MNKNIIAFLLLIASVLIAIIIWEYVKIPYNLEKQIIGESYLINLHNPLNDKLRFIIFLSIPLLTLIIFFQKTEKKFLKNFKDIILFDYQNSGSNNKDLNRIFYLFLFFVLIEFLTLNFTKYTFKIDIFHEGLWLAAAQNLKTTEKFWLSSYIGRGFFGNFHPYFIWNFLGVETIGSVRLTNLIIILFNKILLLMIAKKLTTMIDLKDEIKIIFFILLSISFLYFVGYGDPIFITRSFLLLLLILLLFQLFLNFKSNKILLISIGLFSSLSMFWYVDIGIYFNVTIIILLLFFLYRLEFNNFLTLTLSSILSWILIYQLIPTNEFNQFLNNTILIFSTLEYIHGLIYPTPFLGDIRSTRAILFFLITGIFLIFLIKNLNQKNKVFLISSLLMYLISLLYFNYALSRSDNVHIRIGQSFVYLPFLSIFIYLILKKTENKIYLTKSVKFLSVILFGLFIGVEKKYESKSLANIPSSLSSIKKLVYFEDSIYIDKHYVDFIRYYDKLTIKDKCVTIFTNEVALSYFLKKPTCSKFYLMYTATPTKIQKKITQDIAVKRPTFIVYQSSLDLYGKNTQKLKIINKYIKDTYKFHEKFDHWEIYKKR